MRRFRVGALPDAPWDAWVERVALHVPYYLDSEGRPFNGGLNRKVRDVALLIKEEWGRDCVILQKATRGFETSDQYGLDVIGFPVRKDVYGDPLLGRETQRFLGQGDAIVYMGGEDAWPFIVEGAKGFHVGIWWDGPFPSAKKALTAARTEFLFRRCRSMLCVDTNVINWLRARSPKNQGPANRAIYLPNAVPLEKLPDSARSSPHSPLRVIFARRFEPKRGPMLALEALAILAEREAPVCLLMSTSMGQAGGDQLLDAARARGISDLVTFAENDLESVYGVYSWGDVALVPTLWSEGTSYACVEAIAAGLPVVTTTVGGLPNLVVPRFNGYVVSPRALSIADAIHALCDEENWLRQHVNALSMRDVFDKKHWEGRVLSWLRE